MGRRPRRWSFPTHGFCFTRRRQLQNVGFAIRRGIPYRCNADYRALGLRGNDVRWGADMTALSRHRAGAAPARGAPEVRLPRDLLTAAAGGLPDAAAAGAGPRGLDRPAGARRVRFAVIGDFNRHLDREGGAARDASGRIVALWPEINDGEPAGRRARECRQRSSAGPAAATRHGGRTAVDHIVLGRELARSAGGPVPFVSGPGRGPAAGPIIA